MSFYKPQKIEVYEVCVVGLNKVTGREVEGVCTCYFNELQENMEVLKLVKFVKRMNK